MRMWRWLAVLIVVLAAGLSVSLAALPAGGEAVYLPLTLKQATATPIPTPTETPLPPPPTETPGPTPTETPPGSNFRCEVQGETEVCAWVSDPNPDPRYDDQYVYGRVHVNGAGQQDRFFFAMWHIEDRPVACTNLTDYRGIAWCTQGIQAVTPGERVWIDVTISGVTARTWFVAAEE